MSQDPADRIAHRIPDHSRALVGRLLADPLRELPEIVAEIDAYVAFVRAFSRSNPGVDAAAAERLAGRCRALIERVPGRSDEDRRLVQVACLYLVVIEGDLDEGDGFIDDEAVVAAVEAALADGDER